MAAPAVNRPAADATGKVENPVFAKLTGFFAPSAGDTAVCAGASALVFGVVTLPEVASAVVPFPPEAAVLVVSPLFCWVDP